MSVLNHPCTQVKLLLVVGDQRRQQEPAKPLDFHAAGPGWGFLPPGRPWGQTGRGRRAPRTEASTATAQGGRGREAETGRRAPPMAGDVGACNASTAPFLTRSAPQRGCWGLGP